VLREGPRDSEANVIEVDLFGIPNHNHIDVLVEICKIFNAEKINDKLFIKVSVKFPYYIQCVCLPPLHMRCMSIVTHTPYLPTLLINSVTHLAITESISAQLPGPWGTRSNVVCVVHGNQFRPDVGGWNSPPIRLQAIYPLPRQSPPPILWIEVTHNL